MSDERWINVDDNGKIYVIEENDGPRFLRKGAERTKERVSLSKLKSCYDRRLYNEAVAMLKEKGFPVPNTDEGSK